MCTNGCCRNNPCLNGGTCTEICQPTSVRYNCSCPVPFVGKHCEIQLRRSCQDYKAARFTASGLYTVNDDRNQTFQVFCDFDSEPGFAWNLIESFNLSNNHLFKVIFLWFKAIKKYILFILVYRNNEDAKIMCPQKWNAFILNIFLRKLSSSVFLEAFVTNDIFELFCQQKKSCFIHNDYPDSSTISSNTSNRQ